MLCNKSSSKLALTCKQDKSTSPCDQWFSNSDSVSQKFWGTYLKCRFLSLTPRGADSVGTGFISSTPRESESGGVATFEKPLSRTPYTANILCFLKWHYLNILNQTTKKIKYKLRRIETLKTLSTSPWQYPKWITTRKYFLQGYHVLIWHTQGAMVMEGASEVP